MVMVMIVSILVMDNGSYRGGDCDGGRGGIGVGGVSDHFVRGMV